jgi:hypothetical protein
MGAPLDVGLLCEGNLKFGNLAADGVTFIGHFSSKNAVKFEYNPGQPTVKQRLSKKIDEYAQIKDQVYIPKPSEISLSFDTIDADGVGVLMRGTPGALSVAGATATAATLACGVLDLYFPIGAGNPRFITAGSVLVKDSGGTTTYVEGTDYDVDYSMGLLICYSSGAIVVGNIKVSFTSGTYAGKTIAGEAVTQLNMGILFDGRNLADGKRIEVTVPKCVMAPSGAVDFMSDNFAVAQLKGSPVKVGSAAAITVKYITTIPAAYQ